LFKWFAGSGLILLLGTHLLWETRFRSLP
jgi:hypothetical protein